MANVSTNATQYISKYGSGADAYAGTVNSVNAMTGGVIGQNPPYITRDALDAATNLVKVGQYLYELVSKANIPILAQALNLTALGSDLSKASDQLRDRGYIEKSVYAGIVSNLSGIAAVGLVGLAATAASPVLIATATAIGLAGVFASVYGTTAGVAEKAQELAILDWGMKTLDSLDAFESMKWVIQGDARAFDEKYKTDPVLAPALQLGHALDRLAPLSTLDAILNRSASAAPSQGGRLAEASAFLAAVNKLLGGGIVSTPKTLAEYNSLLVTVYPTILSSVKANPEFRLFKVDAVWPQDFRLAYRYALVNLNGFVASGVDYSKFNQNGELELKSENPKGQLTDAWLQDREAMFRLNLDYNIDDGLRNPNGYAVTKGISAGSANTRYIDIGTGQKIEVFANRATPTTLPSRYVMFGTSGVDVLNGSSEDDRLYGGAGADILTGKEGNDYLEGGTGNDDYIFTGLFGNDTITDSDGQGNITIAGAQLGSLTQVQDNVWENASKTLVFTQITAAAASAASGGQPVTNLIIGQRSAAGAGSINATITVTGFKDGDLGINLGQQTKKIETNGFVVADRKSKGDQGSFFEDSQYWIRSQDTPSGPITIDAGAGNDLIGGNSQAETISGGAGHDVIAGGGGKDVLLGGDGFDWIVADVMAKPNGGLDQNGQLVEPPVGYANSDIRTAKQLNLDTDQLGYGWAFYMKADSSTSLPTELVQSGDTSDVYINGGNGTDNIFGGAGNDILDGGADNFNDALSGGYGDDLLLGGVGQDRLNGDETYFLRYADIDFSRHGKDRLYGGAGDDVMFGGGNDDLLIGDAGKDVLDGDSRREGSAIPVVFHGKDTLDGGAGDDELYGGGQADVLLGGEGNDYIKGDAAYYNSANGQHIATGNFGEDEIDGGAGDDFITGEGNDDLILGGSGNDDIYGDRGFGDEVKIEDHGDDEIEGGQGNDLIVGDGGDDILSGDAGDDHIYGDDITIAGSIYRFADKDHGADWIDGGDGKDQLVGGGGADEIWGGAGDDALIGDGDGVAVAFSGADVLYGEEGNDYLRGDKGDDKLYGGAGNDLLEGGDGDDLLDGGAGQDVLKGGKGHDTYVFDAADGGGQIQTQANGSVSYAPHVFQIEDTEGSNTLKLKNTTLESVKMQVFENNPSDVYLVVGGQLAMVNGQLQGSAGVSYTLIKGGLQGNVISKVVLENQVNGQVQAQEMSFRELVGAKLETAVLLRERESSKNGDYLLGGFVDDQLTSVHKGVTLQGGQGNDRLYVDEDAQDTIVRLEAGDGQDTLGGWGKGTVIELGSGLNLADARLVRHREQVPTGWGGTAVKESLRLLLNSDGSQYVTLQGRQAYFDVANSGLSGLRDAEGMQLSLAQLLARGLTILGLDGNESISGTSLDDVFLASSGRNEIYGSAGNDIYEVASGSQTVLQDSQGANLVRFMSRANLDGMSAVRLANSNDLRLTFADADSQWYESCRRLASGSKSKWR
jgi:Ca2+-binding RTX toxin-like protein